MRVYPYVARATYRFANFTTAAFGRPKAYLGACMVKDNGAWSRWVRTAELWDKGVETTLTIRAVKGETVGRFYAADYDEVILAPKPTAAIHLNAPPKAHPYLIDDSGVAQRIVRIPRDASYTYRLGRETYTTVYPDGDLIEIEPEKVAEEHDGQAGALYAHRRPVHRRALPAADYFVAATCSSGGTSTTPTGCRRSGSGRPIWRSPDWG